jgi:hypothetical protein
LRFRGDVNYRLAKRVRAIAIALGRGFAAAVWLLTALDVRIESDLMSAVFLPAFFLAVLFRPTPMLRSPSRSMWESGSSWRFSFSW